MSGAQPPGEGGRRRRRRRRRRAVAVVPAAAGQDSEGGQEATDTGAAGAPRLIARRPRPGLTSRSRLHVRANRRYLLRKQSAFQKIHLVRDASGHVVLYLDKHIQFHSYDEHRYHEALATFPMLYRAPGSVRSALILGGGDGLAARELLRFEEIERLVNVELDPEVTALARRPPVSEINERSFFDPRVELVHQDAARYIEQAHERFDLVLADFPDPAAPVLAKLYAVEFYQRLKRLLRPGALVCVQSLFLPLVYCCIGANLREAFRHVLPYRTSMTTMVYSGFHLAADEPLVRRRPIPDWTRYLNEGAIADMQAFAADEQAYLLRHPPVRDVHRACIAAMREDEALYATVWQTLAARQRD
ncbi:MAG: hypothetical protein KatS3mg102_2363 [Planctomycetota bacterium]|nr:MAG: hypothetical protein KatS3mg102_2363 [Planctomycetota bacterium]